MDEQTGDQAEKQATTHLEKSWVDGTLDVDELPSMERRQLLDPSGESDAAYVIERVIARTPKIKRDPKTEPPINSMFKDRMEREGRLPELRAVVREKMQETGMGYNAALQAVRGYFGFVNTETELRLYREHRKNILLSAAETEDVVQGAYERLESEERAFFAALATLPANAPKAREIEWIEAHPAMMRSTRNKANGYASNVVNITADDILRAPHGPCPSRAAAVQLQHWANNSTKFFEQIMSEAKKKSAEGSSSSGPAVVEVEDDLSELDDLLDFGS